jgi:predicted nucleotidyltransferase
MKPSALIRQHMDSVREVISRFPVRNPRLFGSAARGDDGPESDVDILVDTLPETTFYDLADLEMELERLLGCKVQVQTPGGLAADVAERVRPDLRPM